MRAYALRSASRLAPLLPAALLALAGCGGPVLFAELELPSVAVALPESDFVPVPIAGGGTFQTTFDLGASVPTLADPNVDFQAKLTRITLTLSASGPVPNFNDVSEISLWVLPPTGSSLPDLQLLTWTNPDPTGDLSTITIANDVDQDLMPYMEAGALTVEARYQASAPAITTWRATLAADFWLLVTVEYGGFLGL